MSYGLWGASDRHLCSYDPHSQKCDLQDYFLSLALENILPCLVIGLLVTFVGTVAYIIYGFCCCKCCQVCAWFGASHYLIKGKFLKRRFHGLYNLLFLRGRLYRMLFVALAILNIIFLIVILGLEIKVETETVTYRTRTEKFALEQANVLDQALGAMQNLPNIATFASPRVAAVIAGTRRKVHEFRSQTSKFDDVQAAELSKFIPEMFFIALLLVVSIAGIVAVLLGQRIVLIVYGIILLVALLPTWLYFASSVLLETLYNDICIDNDIAIAGGNSALEYGIIGCNGSTFSNLRSNLGGVYREIEVKVCTYAQTLCGQQNIECPPVLCSLPNLGSIIENATILDSLTCGSPACPRTCGPGETLCYSREVPLPLCTLECRNQGLQGLATRARSLERDSIVFGLYYNLVFSPLANCDFIPMYGNYIKHPLCDGMMMIGVSGVFTLMVCLLMLMQFFLVIAIHITLQEKEKTMFEMAYRAEMKE